MAALLAPTPAHAFDPWAWMATSAVNDAASAILQLVLGFVEMIHKILIQIIVWAGQLMNWIIELDPNYGGAAVYNVWKILRDICNSLFVVFFILIAFSTIFQSLSPNLKTYYWRSALLNVIFAAILINFSLPIGQTVVWAGNQASALVRGLMSGTNIGTTVLTQGNLIQVVAGSNGLSLAAAPFEAVPEAKLSAAQIIAKSNYTGDAKTTLENCIKNNLATPTECSARAARVQAVRTGMAVDAEIKKLNSWSSAVASWNDIYNVWANIGAGAKRGYDSGSVFVPGSQGILTLKGAFAGASLTKPPAEPGKLQPDELAFKIVSTLINDFFLGVLALNFLIVIVFTFVRIPITWLYLSISAFAFFQIAIPGSKAPKEWFWNLVGWSIFAPLYLFAIYIGMFVLNQQGTLLSGLKDTGAFAGIFGIALFYFLTALIFIGGAKFAWATAFKFSGDFKKYAGGWADSLGVSEKSNFGFTTMANVTGLTSRYEAAKARADQFVGDAGAAIKGRAPNLFRSQEEAIAFQKRQLGVRGADAEIDKLVQARIKSQTGILEAQKLDDNGLRRVLNSGNRDAALAAGEMLLKKGGLKDEDKERMLELYTKVSPIAKKEFSKRITEQLQKGSASAWSKYVDETKDASGNVISEKFNFDKFAAVAKEVGKPEDVRKFLDAAMRGEVGNKTSLTAVQLQELTKLMAGSPEDQRAFLEGATKNGRNKVAAIQLMAGMGLIVDRNGRKMLASEAIADRADSLSDLDILDFDEYLVEKNKGVPDDKKEKMPEEIKAKLKASLKKPEKFGKILKNISSPEQQLRILDEYATIKIASATAKRDLKSLEKKERKAAQEIKRMRKQQDKMSDDESKKIDALIEGIEEERSNYKDQIQKLRKDVT